MGYLRVLAIIVYMLTLAGFNSKVDEYAVKAVFIEKFTRFVEWPDECEIINKSKPFIIGIVGENPFEDLLEKIYKERKIKEKEVSIKYFSTINDISASHVLFVSSSMEDKLSILLEQVNEKPVLIVGDTEGYCQEGVMINLFLEKSRINFEINLSAVKESELKLSHLLLKQARIIK